MKFFGFLSVLAAFVAALMFLFGIGSATTAPQQAAIAGMALAIAVIPYVFFRAAQAMKQTEDVEAIRRLLEELIGQRIVSKEEARLATESKAEQPPEPTPAAKTLRSESMGVAGWTWHQLSDGSIRISDPHGGNDTYPSIAAARASVTWWPGPQNC